MTHREHDARLNHEVRRFTPADAAEFEAIKGLLVTDAFYFPQQEVFAVMFGEAKLTVIEPTIVYDAPVVPQEGGFNYTLYMRGRDLQKAEPLDPEGGISLTFSAHDEFVVTGRTWELSGVPTS